MRRLLLTTLMLPMLCEMSQAQLAATPGAMGTPVSTSPPLAVPTVMPPAGAPGAALGAIHLNLANPLAGASVGTIQTCPTTGLMGQAANFPVDSTDATTNPAPGFGAVAISGSCSASAPASSPGILTDSEFSNGAVSLGATVAGGLGLSPVIGVPLVAVPNLSCPGDVPTLETSGTPLSYDSLGTIATPSPSGC